ncbi:hypothetical protein PIROE2DRAFT_8829 [Piromyces sp. E2]|nr:hypothetical protein PIROE2DRAFT_8829 [Piromyces sp. E2]|eukprot:OUM64360.1 hypothetical protein PIROE2DRAFT_8829 [Piromyces sp. E2]
MDDLIKKKALIKINNTAKELDVISSVPGDVFDYVNKDLDENTIVELVTLCKSLIQTMDSISKANVAVISNSHSLGTNNTKTWVQLK